MVSENGPLVKTTGNSAVFDKPVTVDAAFYPQLQGKIRPSDYISAYAIRNTPGTPVAADNPKFQKAVSALERANLPGLNKVIYISSIEDAKNLVPRLPADVKIVSYDVEQSLTPQSELSNIPESVNQFAGIVHAAGKQAGFGPSWPILSSLRNSGNLSAAVKNLDFFGFQGQKVYANGGVQTFEQDVASINREIKIANPNIHFGVQLWLGVETADNIIQEFKSIQNEIDQAGIGTMNDLTGVQTVLNGLGR